MTNFRAWLCNQRVIWIAPLLGILLTLPSLQGGWVLDDHFHRQTLLRSDRLEGILGSRLDLFRFFDGDPDRTQRMMDLGIVPWWTVKDLRGAFWRPVTALTHWLDYTLWPTSPALMHLHSIAWYGVLVFAVTRLFRRLIGPTSLAGLCALLYAIDDAHGMPVGFLANRNAVIAAVFGVLTLILHDRWRRRRDRLGLFLAPLAFAASLLSSESGLGTTAYLFAYALFLECGPLRIRAVSLLPYAVLVAAWRWVWTAQGYGVSGGLSFYVDPLDSPLEFAAGMVQKLPLLLLGQWALPPSDVSIFLNPSAVRVLTVVAVILLFAIGRIVVKVLRDDASREGCRGPTGTHYSAASKDAADAQEPEPAVPTRRLLSFAAVGMFLALLPLCATFPSDRSLLFVGLGGTMLLARFLTAVFGWMTPNPVKQQRSAIALSLGYTLAAIHGVVAPLGLAFRAAFPVGTPGLLEKLHVRTPMDQTVTAQTVVLVNPPSVIHACYLPALREAAGEPVPKRVRVLAPGLPSVTVRRVDAHTLLVRPEDGYLTLFFDRLFRNERQPLSLGQRVLLNGMTVHVTQLTADGRPAAAEFRFDTPLEDRSLRWLIWIDGDFQDWIPPGVGETVELRPDPSGLEWLR